MNIHNVPEALIMAFALMGLGNVLNKTWNTIATIYLNYRHLRAQQKQGAGEGAEFQSVTREDFQREERARKIASRQYDYVNAAIQLAKNGSVEDAKRAVLELFTWAKERAEFDQTLLEREKGSANESL